MAIPVTQAFSGEWHSSAVDISYFPNLREVVIVGDEIEAQSLREDDDENCSKRWRPMSKRKLSAMNLGVHLRLEWSSIADNLDKAFQRLRSRTILSGIPRPDIAVKILVRED